MPTCYRHPGRETGVACSNCGRPICPDCMTPTAVGMRCPECAKERTKVHTVRSLNRGHAAYLTQAIMAICIVAFLAEGSFAVGSTGSSSWIFQEGALYAPLVDQGEWWRLVSGGFLHSGLLHIAFNMYLLYLLGTMLERQIGSFRFGTVYLTALLGGSLGAFLQTTASPTVGASGAIFGLMGYALVALREQRSDPLFQQIGALVLLNLVISIAFSSNVSLGGHVGGLIFGGLAGLAMEAGDRQRLRWIGPALCVGLMAVAVVGALIMAGQTGLLETSS